LKDALATGKSLPTELRKDAKSLGKDLPFDEGQTGALDYVNLALKVITSCDRPNDTHRQ
jgi:hypothetical protein